MPWSANDAEKAHAQGNNVGAEGTLGKNRQPMLGTNRRRRPRYTGSKRCGRAAGGSQLVAERIRARAVPCEKEICLIQLGCAAERFVTRTTRGQAKAGLRVIAEAKAIVAANDEHMWEGELDRIEGELKQVQGAMASSGVRPSRVGLLRDADDWRYVMLSISPL
jgi:hypothetical protein